MTVHATQHHGSNIDDNELNGTAIFVFVLIRQRTHLAALQDICMAFTKVTSLLCAAAYCTLCSLNEVVYVTSLYTPFGRMNQTNCHIWDEWVGVVLLVWDLGNLRNSSCDCFEMKGKSAFLFVFSSLFVNGQGWGYLNAQKRFLCYFFL